MKEIYNIAQNKFNVKFQTGYYPLPGGGGGVVDTSNLVPYTGANKDVNIASNYFKTSKGFDFTKDAYNYFRSFYGGFYNILDFQSKDNGEENFGSIYVRANPEEGFRVSKVDGNGISLNYLLINDSETYSTNPFVSEEGFKKTGGTPTQALTANGDTFDLNTKADLVGGKVPTSQLPPFEGNSTIDDILGNGNTTNKDITVRHISSKSLDTRNNFPYQNGISGGYFSTDGNSLLFVSKNDIDRSGFGDLRFDLDPETGLTLTRYGLNNSGLDYGFAVNTLGLQFRPYGDNTYRNVLLQGTTEISDVNGLTTSLANKADLVDGKIPASQLPAYVDENKKATITVELISQLTTNFYAPNALRINSTALISGSGTLTLKVNDVAYTLTDLIPQGAKITTETTSSSVYNLISIYE